MRTHFWGQTKTYYTLIANLGTFKAYTKVTDPTQAQEIVNRCTDKKALVVQVEKQDKKENPPLLYDLTTLQREANRVLGYSAQQTLDYLQKLYENKLVTYPRTDSQYITEDMETSTQTMIENLLDAKIYSTKILSDYDVINVNTKRLVNNKKVTDHHAILPTVSVTQEKMILLPSGEKSVLLLILYKTLSAAYTPHIYTSTKVVLDIEGTNFIATGKEIQNIGYRFVEEQLKYLLKATEEKEKEDIQDNIILPSMAQGDTLHVSDVKSEEKKTQPQKPYTEDTLLFAMETAGKNIEDQELRDAMKDSGLGTPATRAGIIENIIRTGFVERDKKKLLIPTEKAYTFIDVVTDKIKEPELTAEWEKQLAQVHRGEITGAVFMENITSFIRTFVNDTKTLYSQNPSPIIFKNNKESIGVCPICGKDVIEHQQAFSCSSGKNGCGFVIWKTIASKTITKEQARKLLMKQKTDLIKGFISKSSKPFDAYLILKEDKTITFDFPPRK